LKATCPFCQIYSGKTEKAILFENQTGFVIGDGNPITDGHTLIIPKQHIARFLDITLEQRNDLFTLVGHIKAALDNHYQSARKSVLSMWRLVGTRHISGNAIDIEHY